MIVPPAQHVPLRVALFGLPGAGKSTTVSLLTAALEDADRKVTVVKLAEPLYDVQHAFYRRAGVALAIGRQDGALLNFLGSHFRRIDPEFLLRDFTLRCDAARLTGADVLLCDDARPVDLDGLVARGFRLVRVSASEALRLERKDRRGDQTAGQDDHPTELGDAPVPPAFELRNDGSLAALEAQVAALVGGLLERPADAGGPPPDSEGPRYADPRGRDAGMCPADPVDPVDPVEAVLTGHGSSKSRVGAFQEFLVREFPGADIRQISDTNNAVFLVSPRGSKRIVAKHLTDVDIPLDYVARTNKELSLHVPAQRVLKIFQTDRGDPFDALYSEYVEGRNLADELGTAGALSDTAIVEYLCGFVRACAHLPRLHDGFGLYKRTARPMSTHREFVEFYGRRYWNRARPFYEGTKVATAVDRWLDGGFAAAAERNPAPFTVISADSNLKNWIVDPTGGISVLNVPIVALSSPAHAVGAVSLHLRNRAIREEFLASATATLCPNDAEMVPHFELWGLLGILSFYAVREPERQKEWQGWGSPVTLDADFRNLVETEIMPQVM